MNLNSVNQIDFIRSQWTEALEEVLASMTSETFTTAAKEMKNQSDDEASSSRTSWYRQTLSSSADSHIWVGATNDTWSALAKSLLSRHGVDEPSPSEIGTTCEEIVTQTNAALAQRLAARSGAEVTWSSIIQSERRTTDPVMLVSLRAPMFSVPLEIQIAFDKSFFNSSSLLSKQFQPTPPHVPSSISNLHLRLHASLGKTDLLLDNVLKLSMGSVIDIGRSVSDLVDVVANGKVIARGHVVAFKGNYAIKVVSTSPGGTLQRAVLRSGAGASSCRTSAPLERTGSAEGDQGYDA